MIRKKISFEAVQKTGQHWSWDDVGRQTVPEAASSHQKRTITVIIFVFGERRRQKPRTLFFVPVCYVYANNRYHIAIVSFCRFTIPTLRISRPGYWLSGWKHKVISAPRLSLVAAHVASFFTFGG